MRIETHNTAGSFRNAAMPMLMEHEARNSLLVGLSMRWPEDEQEALKLTIHDGEAVVGAAVMEKGRALILSDMLDWAGKMLADYVHDGAFSYDGFVGPRPAIDAFARLMAERVGRPFVPLPQRIHQLVKVSWPRPAAGRMVVATEELIDPVHEFAVRFHREAMPDEGEAPERTLIAERLRGGTLRVWMLPEGRPVALAGRSRPTPNGASISIVYTPVAERGKGYASNLVAALSQEILDDGKRFVFLYTDLRNPTSNHIYSAIGYEPVVDSMHYRLA